MTSFPFNEDDFEKVIVNYLSSKYILLIIVSCFVTE